MSDIQDKTFDRLFKDKLDSFEGNVPTDMWGRISNELDGGEKHGRSEEKVAPFVKPKMRESGIRWSYAASIALLLGIGVVLLNRPKSIIYLNAGNQLPEMAEELDRYTVDVPGESQWSDQRDVQADDEQLEYAALGLHEHDKEDALSAVDWGTQRNTDIHTENPLAESDLPASNVAEVKNPTIAVELSEEPIVVDENAFAVLASNVPHLVVVEDSYPAEKKSFDVSKVLNYVVGVVDKGDDKVLAFKRDDEGSISIAFNLKSLRRKKQDYMN